MSAPIIRHHGVVKRHKVLLLNTVLFDKNIDLLEGKKVTLTIEEVHETPTKDQYAYYRGGVLETALTAECFGGWTADEVDEHFSDTHLGFTKVKKFKKKDGTEINTVIRVIPSKADISKKDMGIFIDKCINDLAQEGVEVLDSNLYKLTKYKTIHANER